MTLKQAYIIGKTYTYTHARTHTQTPTHTHTQAHTIARMHTSANTHMHGYTCEHIHRHVYCTYMNAKPHLFPSHAIYMNVLISTIHPQYTVSQESLEGTKFDEFGK